jgi:hypothetical protein
MKVFYKGEEDFDDEQYEQSTVRRMQNLKAGERENERNRDKVKQKQRTRKEFTRTSAWG